MHKKLTIVNGLISLFIKPSVFAAVMKLDDFSDHTKRLHKLSKGTDLHSVERNIGEEWKFLNKQADYITLDTKVVGKKSPILFYNFDNIFEFNKMHAFNFKYLKLNNSNHSNLSIHFFDIFKNRRKFDNIPIFNQSNDTQTINLLDFKNEKFLSEDPNFREYDIFKIGVFLNSNHKDIYAELDSIELFQIRADEPINEPLSTIIPDIPEPFSIIFLGSGLIGTACKKYKKTRTKIKITKNLTVKA